MKRRALISLTGSVTVGAALPAFAQAVPQVYRVGILGSAGRKAQVLLPLTQALGALGYEEGRNIQLEQRFTDGLGSTLDGLANELVALNVDLIVAISNPSAIAARRASSKIPIVVIALYLPVESGLVASLARPSGNITGTMFPGPQTQAKNLQILRDAFPDARRVARLSVTAQAGTSQYDSAARQVASALGTSLTILPCNSAAEIETALALVEREPPDALWIGLSGGITTHRARIIDFSARRRVPAIYSESFAVREGGLMSYSYNFSEMIQRSAAMVLRVLQGSKPSDLPVEQPTKYDLVINLKTARAMNLTIPRSVLLQATEVIE